MSSLFTRLHVAVHLCVFLVRHTVAVVSSGTPVMLNKLTCFNYFLISANHTNEG